MIRFVWLLFACWSTTTLMAADRPNILYLYVDDMGWGSIGPNGQAERRAKGLPAVQTPNLDQLAARGLNFTRGYGCHVCSPARSSQQTGFHQGHTFADRNDPNNAKKAIRADDVTMGDALAAAGYVTGYWGKWGYGGSQNLVQPVIENVQTLPTSHGYRYVLAELHHVRAHTFFQPTLWSAPAPDTATGGLQLIPNSLSRLRSNAQYPESPAQQNHSGYPETAYCDDSYAFAALDFVRMQAQNYNQSGQPFFGLLAVQIPHAPFGEITVLPDWDAAYAGDAQFQKLAEQSQQWAAMVTRIDAHFGNLFAALADPNQDGDPADSIIDNTLIVFQSDNGGPNGKNLIELNANGGLSGTKGSIQEGGIRVPLVMSWPAKIHETSNLKAGSNVDRVVDVSDLLPTFCELAGATTPLAIDGVSIAPWLTGSGQPLDRESIIHEADNGQSIIRGNQKLVRTKKSYLLFDLQSDPTESNNLATEQPALVKELAALLLGERVDEPRGFANTYHRWTGVDGAATSDAMNWSDYRYENAGNSYQFDDGAPQLSWIAQVQNSGGDSRSANVDRDLECLGIEVRGESEQAIQSLVLARNVNLIGRNEVRIAAHGSVTLNGGELSTLRWIDVQPAGELIGSGTIDGKLLNRGTITVAGAGVPRLDLLSDFHQSAGAVLSVTVNLSEPPHLVIAGDANLSGNLVVRCGDRFKPSPNVPYVLLNALSINGRFLNPDDEVYAADGTRFKIHYTDHTVALSWQD